MSVKLDFEKCGGLIPAIAQDHQTGEVLMMAYINEESWQETLRSGYSDLQDRTAGRGSLSHRAPQLFLPPGGKRYSL